MPISQGRRKDPTGRWCQVALPRVLRGGGGGRATLFQVLGLCQLSLIFLTPAFGFFSFQDGEGGRARGGGLSLGLPPREIPRP